MWGKANVVIFPYTILNKTIKYASRIANHPVFHCQNENYYLYWNTKDVAAEN